MTPYRLIAPAILAVLPLAAPAQIVGSVGGYMNFGAGYSSDIGTGADGKVGIIRDGEIHLGAMGKSDNGLTFRVRVELEAFTTTDQIDENFATVEGGFGRFVVGGNDSAANEVGGVGGLRSTFPITYFDEDFTLTPASTGGYLGENSDGIGIRYDTNKLLGPIVLGVSYIPDVGVDSANDSLFAFSETSSPTAAQQYSFGGSYKDKIGEVGLEVGIGYVRNTEDWNGFHGGATVSIPVGDAKVSLGGVYEFIDDDNGDDIQRYAVGLDYTTGPWSVGGGYYGCTDDAASFGVRCNLGNGSGGETEQRASLGVSYAIMPGAKAIGVVEYGDNDTDDGVAVAGLIAINF